MLLVGLTSQDLDPPGTDGLGEVMWQVTAMLSQTQNHSWFWSVTETGFPHCWMTWKEAFAFIMHLASQSSLTNSSEKETKMLKNVYILSQGFSTLALPTFRTPWFFIAGDCPVHRKMCSFPGLCLPDARGTRAPLGVTTKMPPDIAKHPPEGKIAPSWEPLV